MKHPIWATVTDARALFLPHLKSQNDENKKRAQKNPFLKEIRGATRGDEEKMVTTMTTMTMEIIKKMTTTRTTTTRTSIIL